MEKVKAWNSLTCVRMSKKVANQENTLNRNKYVFPESHPETNYFTNNEGLKKYSFWLSLLMSKCFHVGRFKAYSEHILNTVSFSSKLLAWNHFQQSKQN